MKGLLFNEDRKELFLDEITNSPDSRRVYRRIFVKSHDDEMKYEKDLCEFTEEQLISFLTSLQPTTDAAADHNGRVVSSYLGWCIKNGHIPWNGNPLESFTPEMFAQLVDHKIKIYISEEELNYVLGGCQNAQDQLMLVLPFYGVCGEAGSEIRYLKNTDVDFINKKLHVKNVKEETTPVGRKVKSFTERTVTIDGPNSERVFDIIDRAIKQTHYIRRNGMVEDDTYGVRTVLVENNFVARSGKTNTEHFNDAIDKTTFFRRINIVSKTLEYPYLNAKNLQRSGMIYMAKNLYEAEGKLEKEQYLKICEQFDVKPNMWFSLKKFCNLEAIYALYHTGNKSLTI